MAQKRTQPPTKGKATKRPKTAAELLSAVRAEARSQWDAIHAGDDNPWPEHSFRYIAGLDEHTRVESEGRKRESKAAEVYASLRSALLGVQALLEQDAQGAGACERFLRALAPSVLPLLDRSELGPASAAYWTPLPSGEEWTARDSVVEWAEQPMGIGNAPRDPMRIGRPATMRELALIAILAGVEPTMHPGKDTVRDVIEREEKRFRKRRKALLERMAKERESGEGNGA
jgi:hypothetical protein